MTPHNDTFLRALLRQPTPYTPVWMMRQAGRYLPEYRATRQQAGDFLSLCKNPDLATEVTLQPLARYPLLDAAILFSDILTIPDAMGLGLGFVEGEGPVLAHPLQSESAIARLAVPDMESLRYVFATVEHIKSHLQNRLPLIGFAGSPWTLATYMIEGRGGSDFVRCKKMLYDAPHLLHRILDITTQAVTAYLNAQIEAGVDAVMVFDSWAGVLSSAAYQTFSLNYVKTVMSQLTRKREASIIPRILFSKGGGGWLEAQAGIDVDALGLDWTVDMGSARARVGNKVALQGNLDPSILLTSPTAIRGEVAHILASYDIGSGHVFNLGHGILPNTPPEHVEAMLLAVRELSTAYHTHALVHTA